MMNNEENKIYLQKIDEIRGKVYEIYNMSNREDLIIVYEMIEEKIYSYVYEDFIINLNERSREILIQQYNESKKSKKIVLFIRDKIRKKFKSFTI